MSTLVETTCDGCGAVKPGQRGLTAPWWDWQFTSMDVPSELRIDGIATGWPLLSGSWDLCPTCSKKVRAAIDAAGER